MQTEKTNAPMKAIVTGHSRGLGCAVAQTLLDRGIAVLGLSRGAAPELAARYPVRAVQGHQHIAPGRKSDPGPHFDWPKLQDMLAPAASTLVGANRPPGANVELRNVKWPHPNLG